VSQIDSLFFSVHAIGESDQKECRWGSLFTCRTFSHL